MSYNIDNIDICASDGFCIARPAWQHMQALHGNECPEASFLDEDWPARSCEEHRGMFFVNRISWESEGSGRTFDIFKQLLSQFSGSADLVLTWEGGDSHTGLRLLNGVVTEHDVVMALGKLSKP